MKSFIGEVETIANASVAMGVVLLLKMHLQELYNISDRYALRGR